MSLKRIRFDGIEERRRWSSRMFFKAFNLKYDRFLLLVDNDGMLFRFPGPTKLSWPNSFAVKFTFGLSFFSFDFFSC